MYIFGGILELTKELNELLCYDFATGKFTVMCGDGAAEDNFAFTAGHGGDESPSAIKKIENGASPTKTKKNNFASTNKSPSKTMAARKKAMLGLDKEDTGDRKESGLASPTSISMQNTFIIKNADESFDAYFAQMKKRKFGGNTGIEGGHSATLQGSSPGQKESHFGVVKGIQPAARDGHSTEVSSNGLMFVFGGDRHHTYKFLP